MVPDSALSKTIAKTTEHGETLEKCRCRRLEKVFQTFEVNVCQT